MLTQFWLIFGPKDSNWDAYQSKSATGPNPKRNSLNRSSLASPFLCRRRARQRNSNSQVVNSHHRPEATFVFFYVFAPCFVEKQAFGQEFRRWWSCVAFSLQRSPSPAKCFLTLKMPCVKHGKRNRNSHICKSWPKNNNFIERFSHFMPCSRQSDGNKIAIVIVLQTSDSGSAKTSRFAR